MTADTGHRSIDLLADGLHFPEGPRWHDGRLYVSDFYDRVVLAYRPDGSRTVVCEVPGQPSGLGFTPAGDLLISSMLDHKLLRYRQGEVSEVADLGALVGGSCNDLYVDAAGRAYVGNFGSDMETSIDPTVLVRVDPDGSVAVAARDLVFPNGTVTTADGTLLISETFAYRISAFDVDASGNLANRRVWASFGGEPAADLPTALATEAIAPDGVCLDAEGALWVGDAQGTGAVRVREGGEIVDRVELDGLTAFAVALGGEDGRTLYLAAGPPLGEIDPAAERRGSLLSVRVDVPGAAWA
jgi:sugar lactone lactonase YvrE